MNVKLVIALVVAAILFLAAPTLMGGQTAERPPGDANEPVEILVRFNQDVDLLAGESSTLVVVGGGNARIARTAGAVFVLDGTAELLPTARVGHLAVVRGNAVLRQGVEPRVLAEAMEPATA
jgi:hypothetical protein